MILGAPFGKSFSAAMVFTVPIFAVPNTAANHLVEGAAASVWLAAHWALRRPATLCLDSFTSRRPYRRLTAHRGLVTGISCWNRRRHPWSGCEQLVLASTQQIDPPVQPGQPPGKLAKGTSDLRLGLLTVTPLRRIVEATAHTQVQPADHANGQRPARMVGQPQHPTATEGR